MIRVYNIFILLIVIMKLEVICFNLCLSLFLLNLMVRRFMFMMWVCYILVNVLEEFLMCDLVINRVCLVVLGCE